MPEKPAWVEVQHDKHGGITRVPNRPHVLADFAKRGWKPVSAADGGSKVKEQVR